MPNPHGPGLADHAHLAFVEALAPRLAEADHAALATMLAWLAPGSDNLRTKDAGKAIAALLGPWRHKTPPEQFRRKLQDGLVKTYGDPRVHKGGVWGNVPDDLQAVIRRWLTGATMKAFLDIVSQVEESHMWEPRRKFWWDLYEQGRVTEAWVALSERGVQLARRMGVKEFGHQTARGTRVNTSLLIMRIGKKIVVEGSHNYMIHVFPADHKHPPKLYRRDYDCERIRLSLDDRHKRVHDQWGGWRSWVMERI
jgi:hypothetical protein